MSETAERTLAVGDPINTVEDVIALPVGTVIRVVRYPEDTYTKVALPNGWVHDINNSSYDGGTFSWDGYNEVASLPDGAPPPPAEPRVETLQQYQWRYRDNALWSAYSAGVSMGQVFDTLSGLGITDDRFPLGEGMEIENPHDLSRLERGSVVTIGSPLRLNQFGVWVRVAGDWRLVLGNLASSPSGRVTVLSTPSAEQPGWITENGTEEDEQQIAEWKARAWQAGWKLKRANSWCDSYENYMARIGLDSSALQVASGLRVGDKVTAEQAATLPVGTLLRWVSTTNPARWVYYQRVRSHRSRNEAITMRVAASVVTTHHFASTMEVITYGTGTEDDWSSTDWSILATMPPGTRFESGDETYQIQNDHRYDYPGDSLTMLGQWALNEFDQTVPYTITRIGAPFS